MSILPQNYVKNGGTAFEGFEAITDWTFGALSGTGNQEADTTHYKEGTQGLKINATSAGGDVYTTKTINQVFSADTLFSFWVYLPNRDDVSYIKLSLASLSNFTKMHTIQLYVKLGDVSNNRFMDGWNHIHLKGSDFTSSGGEVWSSAKIRMQFRLISVEGHTSSITVDKFDIDPQVMPRLVIGWDGGLPTQYSKVYPIMTAAGLKFTIYLTENITAAQDGTTATYAQLDEIYQAGHCIANHAKTHLDLTTLTQSAVENELSSCANWLSDHGWDRGRYHVAYPGGYNNAIVRAAMHQTGMLTGRGVQRNIEPTPVGEMFQIKCLSFTNALTVPLAISWVETAISHQTSLWIYGHAVDEVNPDYWPEQWLIDFCAYLKARKIECVTVDEWYEGLTNPRYRPIPVARSNSVTFNVGQWEQIGPEGLGEYSNDFMNDMAIFNDYLYVGMGKYAGPGGEIWRSLDGENWSQANTDGFGNANNYYITCLFVFGGYLYAGTYKNGAGGGEIWRTQNGTTWTSVTINGFSDINNIAFISFCNFQGTLYTITMNSVTGMEVWRSSDGENWSQDNTDGFGNANNRGSVPYSKIMTVFNNYLYIGTYSNVVDYGNEVWRSSGGSNWSKVCDNGFGDTKNKGVTSLGVFGEYLYATTGNSTTGVEIWRTQTGSQQSEWAQVIDDGFNISPVPSSSNVVIVYDGYLYVNAFTSDSDVAFLWRTQVGSQQSDWERANANGFGLDRNFGRMVWSGIEFDNFFYAGVSGSGGQSCRMFRLHTGTILRAARP